MKKSTIEKETQEELRSIQYHEEQIEFSKTKVEWLRKMKDKL